MTVTGCLSLLKNGYLQLVSSSQLLPVENTILFGRMNSSGYVTQSVVITAHARTYCALQVARQ